MNEFDEYEYEFELDAYTPATIPMERLAKYMTMLAKLFGNHSSVHFSALRAGSTCLLQKVDYEAIPKIEARLNALKNHNAISDEKVAFDEINKMCAADNATGAIYRRKDNARVGEVFIMFEGIRLAKPVRFGPFAEPVSFDGELVRIGGKDKTAHATIIDPEGVAWNGEMTKELAAGIAQYLYRGTLRLHGNAKWFREETGEWVLQDLKINGFEALKEETLQEVTDRLRHLKNSDWHKIENIDEHIRLSRGDDEVLH